MFMKLFYFGRKITYDELLKYFSRTKIPNVLCFSILCCQDAFNNLTNRGIRVIHHYDLHKKGIIHRNLESTIKEVKTSILNDMILDAYNLNLPPSYKGKRLKIYFTSQTGINPPKFTFRVNNKGLVHFSYERYLENKIRENFDFEGTPIVLQFKNRSGDE